MNVPCTKTNLTLNTCTSFPKTGNSEQNQSCSVFAPVPPILSNYFFTLTLNCTTRKKAMKVAVSYYARHGHSALILKSWYHQIFIQHHNHQWWFNKSSIKYEFTTWNGY
eukprot:553412_1